MEFKEYPKALYRGDEFTTVPSKDVEDAKRADGWHDHGQEPAAQQNAGGTDGETASKEQLLEQAKALGVDAKGTWGVKKLQEAIAYAQQNAGGE